MGSIVMLERGTQLQADVVLSATGRVANTQGLGLEKVAWALDDSGAIIVDAHYRSRCRRLAPATCRPACNSRQWRSPRRWWWSTRLFADPKQFQVAPQGRLRVHADGRVHPPQRRHLRLHRSRCAAEVRRGHDLLQRVQALRHTLSDRSGAHLSLKLIAKRKPDRVVGSTWSGPMPARSCRALPWAMRAGATKAFFDSTIGIHPTAAKSS